MKKNSVSLFGVLAVSTIALGTGCREDLVADGTFRNWCGDKLCNWTLEAGRVERSATWSEADQGVRFVGTPTRISTRLLSGARCIEIGTMASIAGSAGMTVSLDLNDDGVVDYSYPMASVDWRETKISIQTTEARVGTRIILEKTGSGNAVLGAIRVKVGSCTEGSVSASIAKKNLHTNDVCGADGDCASGICCQGHCSACCPNAPSNCVGDQCPADCVGDACKFKCEGDTVCKFAGKTAADVYGIRRPNAFLCGPGERAGKPGAPCFDNADCASSVCREVRQTYVCLWKTTPEDVQRTNVPYSECEAEGDLCPDRLIGTDACRLAYVTGTTCR